MMWLPLSLLLPASLWLARRKLRHQAPFWPWWLILLPFWLPVALLVGFGLAMLVFAVFLLFLNGRPV